MPYFEFADGSFISTGGNKPTNVLSKSIQFSDNITWTKGQHTIKGGIDVQRVEFRDQSSFFSGDDYGAYFFTGQFTGNAFADFLLGLPATTRYAQNPPDAEPYTTQFAGYVQDDWRAIVQADGQLRRPLRPAAALPGPRQPARQLRSRLSRRAHHRGERGRQGAHSAVGEERRSEHADRHRGRSRDCPSGLRKTDKNNINPRVGVRLPAVRTTGRR